MFNHLAAAIENDLGGRSELSAVELQLVEAFCGASIAMNAINARLLRDEQVDLLELPKRPAHW
jgi:hypothetical protein